MPVWFDPNPLFEVDPNVPAGKHDFVGIYTHEIFHSLGLWPRTQQWDALFVVEDRIDYFIGPAGTALFGGPIPFNPNRDHYGHASEPALNRGLMYEFGNYDRNRWDIGRIDLAILADLGHTIKSYEGLPLFEFLDTRLDLTGSGAGESLYGDYHANVLNGKGGDDTIFAGSGNDSVYGEAGGDFLFGGAGHDRLDGGAEADRLEGGAGDDFYHVDDAGDVVIEAAFGGSDTVLTRVSYRLTPGQEIESLRTWGSATTHAADLTGNEYRNTLVGNAAANVLDGKSGADVMWGYDGNDIYYVDHAGDVVGGEGARSEEHTTAVKSHTVLSVSASGCVVGWGGGLRHGGGGLGRGGGAPGPPGGVPGPRTAVQRAYWRHSPQSRQAWWASRPSPAPPTSSGPFTTARTAATASSASKSVR